MKHKKEICPNEPHNNKADPSNGRQHAEQPDNTEDQCIAKTIRNRG
ncbi:hypothetical protein [Porphyromonas miyakawae]